jgi:predicted ferric reductase
MNRHFGLSREDFQPAESVRDRVQAGALALFGVLGLICQALFLGFLGALVVQFVFPRANFGNWVLFLSLVFLVVIVFVFHTLATAPRDERD